MILAELTTRTYSHMVLCTSDRCTYSDNLPSMTAVCVSIVDQCESFLQTALSIGYERGSARYSNGMWHTRQTILIRRFLVFSLISPGLYPSFYIHL